MEAMLTIDPDFLLFMIGTTCLAVRKSDLALTAMILSHASRLSSSMGVNAWGTPAQLTSTSTAPKASRVPATIPLTLSSSETSVRITRTRSPSRPAAALSAASRLTSAKITRAPCSAKSRAVAFPIPDAAPVTTAVFPSSRSDLTWITTPRFALPRVSAGSPGLVQRLQLAHQLIPHLPGGGLSSQIRRQDLPFDQHFLDGIQDQPAQFRLLQMLHHHADAPNLCDRIG